MGKLMGLFDSAYFWMASKFKDDHNLIGARQLILLAVSQTLYIIIPILLFMLYAVPADMREVIKPYGKGDSLVLYLGLILLNRMRYKKKIARGEQVQNFKTPLLYYLILFFPLIIIVVLFYRPWL